jgi:hypothetical protein
MSFLKRLTVLFPMLGIVACVASGCNQTPQSQIALQPDSAPEASASAPQVAPASAQAIRANRHILLLMSRRKLV